MTPLRLALCQLNPTVGDLAGNERCILDALEQARAAGAQLVVFPELMITGYPPEDLLLKEHFLTDARATLDRIAASVTNLVAFIGFPERAEDVYNALAVCADGKVQAVYRKMYLPNYGVFDEARYFQNGPGPAIVEVGEHRIGLTICEDCWEPGPPASDEALAGATVIVNPSASPYHMGKGEEREAMFAQRARDLAAVFAFCGLVGGQDELVFDGHSLVFDHEGELLARASQFEEEVLVVDIDPTLAATSRLRDPSHRPAARRTRPEVPVLARIRLPGYRPTTPAAPRLAEPLDRDSEVYRALCLGLQDYVEKNGFRHVVLGLSGGIDSTLVALIAADALGADRVTLVTMPSPYSSQGTRDDAAQLAQNLGVELLTLPIAPAMKAFDATLSGVFDGHEPDITEENLQARIRGNILMALSNKFGWLVLTTGNKSENAVGYSTLYGDTAGGFAVIKDCSKELVYRLVRHRDAQSGDTLVPPDILTRPPSAELRYEQRDDQSLPPYDILDQILEGYVERDLDREQLVARGLPADEVARIVGMVDRAEYKRRQVPPGIKVTPRAFGRDRRLPITNRYGG